MKKLAILLIALCTVLLLAFPAVADTTVEVDNKNDLKAALASTEPKTVKLIGPIALDGNEEVSVNGNHTIDLNGHNLTILAGHKVEFFNGKALTLTITDSSGSANLGKVLGGGSIEVAGAATLSGEKSIEIACNVTNSGTIKGGHYTGDITCAADSTLTGDATHKTRISLLKALPATVSGDVTIDILCVNSYDAFNKAIDDGYVAGVKLEGSFDDHGNLRSNNTIGRDFTINMDDFNTEGGTISFLLNRGSLTVASGKTLTISNSTDDLKSMSASIDVAKDAKLVLDGFLIIDANVSFDISVTDVNTALTRKPYTKSTAYPTFLELTAKNQGQMDFVLNTDASIVI